jgi:hypothetical protein
LGAAGIYLQLGCSRLFQIQFNLNDLKFGIGKFTSDLCCKYSFSGNSEMKCGPLSGTRFSPDPCTMSLHDLRADGQPHTGAGMGSITVQALKNHEDLSLILVGVESDAAVKVSKAPGTSKLPRKAP